MRLYGLLILLASVGMEAAKGDVFLGALSTTTIPLAKGAQTSTTFLREGPGNIDLIDVIAGDSQTAVSLTDPAGAVITPQNAGMSGYTWSQMQPADQSLWMLPSIATGVRHVITIPSNAAAGTYTITFDSSGIAADAAAVIAVHAGSNALFGVALASDTNLKPGASVVLAAALMEGDAPITGTVTADISVEKPDVELSQGAVTEMSSSPVDGQTLKQISIQVVNRGGHKQEVIGVVDGRLLPAGVTIDQPFVTFPDIPAGSTVTSADNIQMRCSTQDGCDPSSLQLQFSTESLIARGIQMKDDGNGSDGAAGDGVYAASFTPQTAGRYHVSAHANASTQEGAPIERVASTDFEISGSTIDSLSFSPNYSAQNTVSSVIITANVTVQQAGTYSLCIDLATSDRDLTSCQDNSLQVGSGTLSTTFSASDLLSLNAPGSYPIQSARLFYRAETAEPLVASVQNPLTITGVAPSTLDHGPLFFTGANSAAGVRVSQNDSLYSSLHIQIGVVSPGGSCSLSGELTTAAGNRIGYFANSVDMPAGAGQISADVDGTAINTAGVNGPFEIQNVEVACGAHIASAKSLFETPTFSSSNFAPPPTITLSLSSLAVSLSTSADFDITIQYQTHGDSTLTADNSEPGIYAFLDTQTVTGSGTTGLTIHFDPTYSYPGTYTVQVDLTQQGVLVQAPIEITVNP